MAGRGHRGKGLSQFLNHWAVVSPQLRPAKRAFAARAAAKGALGGPHIRDLSGAWARCHDLMRRPAIITAAAMKPETSPAAGQPMPTALVTGSSRGIGAAIASALEARGFAVIRHGTRAAGPMTLAADLSDAAATARLWDDACALAADTASGRIDVLVNNAGVFEASPISGTDAYWLAEWERCLRVNLTSAAQLSRLAVKGWLEGGLPGRLVNIASRSAYRGDSPDHWHYAAAKAGEVAMTKTIARAYAKKGILAFAICPGFTDSSGGDAEDYLASRGGPALLNDIPLGRVALPTEIAAMAAFCASDAPPSMTGAVLDANGASYVR